MIKATRNHLLLAATGLFVMAAAGCVSEKATPGAPVKDASFLGYSNPDTKQTTCGNCHSDMQAKWAQTKHASAWADLQASGHASASCEPCHTTNGATNPGADNAGFLGVSADAKRFYQDVQCEACHGPGSTHISAPGATQPIPTFLVDPNRADGCAACHTGTHNGFAEQLEASRHGRMPYWEEETCQLKCHNGTAALAMMNPRFQYRDMGSPTDTLAPNPGLTCSVCHDAHDATNPAQLRLGLTSADTAQHMCGKCHNRGPVATASSWRTFRGAHSAQFAVLQGYAGYVPWTGVKGPARHASIEGSCAGCHMYPSAVNDAGGKFAVQNTGHTFEVGPCLSPTATATGGVDTSAACTEDKRDWSACASGGCHGSAASARDAMERLQTEIKGYANVLWKDVNGNSSIQAFPTDSGWIPLLLAHDSRFAAGSKRLATTGADTVFTVAKGARFNVQTFASPNRHADGSFGVHNPGFVRAVLQQTIKDMWATYGTSDTLPPAPAAIQAAIRSGITRR